MNLIPWRKKHSIPVGRETTFSTPLSEFRGEMDRLFDRYFRGWFPQPAAWSDELDWPTREFIPSIDVSESDKQITIVAELPGMDPDDIDIHVSGNVLTMHGEKRASAEDRGDDYYHCERCFGAFTRNVELPTTADLDHIDAECCNGVLKIIVDKVPTAKSKKIDVKTASPMIAEA